MKDLNVAAARCMKKLDALKIPYGNVLRFEVNRRAKKRWGQTRMAGGNRFTININEALLREDIPDATLDDTILHELLHTCKGCLNHGSKWKALAEKVNLAYGCNIKCTTSAAEKGIEYEPVKRMDNYQYRCQKCGQIVTRQRPCKFTREYLLYRCGICGGTFDRIK